MNQNDAYIKGCAFHHGFSPAIGIFGTDGLSVDDNIIHHTVGEGITCESPLINSTGYSQLCQMKKREFSRI